MLTIAAGTVDISPEAACEMGCGDVRVPTADVRDRLEANIIVLSSAGTQVVLISVDALYAGSHLRSTLDTELEDLDPGAVFLGASHTHYAPMLDESKPALGTTNGDHVARVASAIVDKTRELLLEPGCETSVQFATYESLSAVNRRLKRWIGGAEGMIRRNVVANAPNPKLTHPQTSTIIKFSNNGDTHAYIWQHACHPTSLPSGSGHSAHFPGEWRREVRSEEGSNIPMVFFQGFSGDLRPPSVAVPSGPSQWGRRLVLGPWFDAFSEDEYGKWLDSLDSERRAAQFSEAVDAAPDQQQILSTQRTEEPLATFVEAADNSNRVVSAHRVSIGPIDLIGVSAEAVSVYSSVVGPRAAGRHVVTVGCIDDVFGYAPTDSMIAEGGYESSGFLPHFGLSAFRPGFQDRFSRLMNSTVDHGNLDPKIDPVAEANLKGADDD